MKSGGKIPWNGITICRMSKTSWQTGNLKMNEDLVNHSKDQLYYLTHWWISPKTPRERQSTNSSICTAIITNNLSRICFDRGWIWEAKKTDCWYWRNGKVRCIRNISQKTECERSPDNPKKWTICISYGRWFSKIIRKKLRIPRTHSETGIHRKERESQRRISWR